MKKRVTIRDIARMADVSTASVSAVLTNSHAIRLSEQTRARILKAMRAAGYQHRKRADTKGTPLSVAVFSRYPLHNPFTSNILKGIERTLAQNGGRMFVSLTEESALQIAAASSSLLAGINGAIFISRIDPLCAEALRVRSIPFVVAGSGERYDDQDMVYSDPLGYPRAALAYLTGLGHRKIGFVLNPPQHFAQYASRLVFMEHLRTHFAGQEANYLRTAVTQEEANEAIRTLLSGRNRPTALAGLIFGAAPIILQMGLRIPEDISILAYDSPGVFGGQPLSWVGSDQEYLGAQAVAMLRARIAAPREPVRHIVVPVKITDNGSCAKLN